MCCPPMLSPDTPPTPFTHPLHALPSPCRHHRCLRAAAAAVYMPPLPPSTCHRRRCLCATATAVYMPPLPPSTRLSLESRCSRAMAYAHPHLHHTQCHMSTSRDHSSGVFCSPSLLSNICSCYPQLPTPRPVTPKPNLEPASDNFAHPCPTCHPGNAYGWRCPIPIPDCTIDQENAFDLDDGTPTSHAFCGNCDQLHNIQAPTSTKCDFFQVLFCGVGIQGRCCAIGLLSQQLHSMVDFLDLILSGTIYDCFQRNLVKVSKTRYSNHQHLVTRNTGGHTFILSHDERDLLAGHI